MKTLFILFCILTPLEAAQTDTCPFYSDFGYEYGYPAGIEDKQNQRPLNWQEAFKDEKIQATMAELGRAQRMSASEKMTFLVCAMTGFGEGYFDGYASLEKRITRFENALKKE